MSLQPEKEAIWICRPLQVKEGSLAAPAFRPQASSTATAFHVPLTPAMTEPSRMPARNSVSVRLAKAGLAAIFSMDRATSTPWMEPSVLFQVQ